VPRVTAWAIIGLCALIVARAVPRLRAPWDDAPAFRDHWFDMAVVLVALVAYVAALHLRLTAFAVMTSVYVLVTVGLLVRLKRRLLPWVVVVALVTGFGSQYVFTRIFIVDLPGR